MKKLFHVFALAVLALAAGSAYSAAVVVCPGVCNPFALPITLDGQFTNGLPTPGSGREWSDVTPLAFISPPLPDGTLQSTTLNDPNRNSLLYGAVAPGELGGAELYLMYDYLPRTIQSFAPGEFIADISFPITVPFDTGDGIREERKNATVQIRGHVQATSIAPTGAPFFDVFIDLNDGSGPQSAGNFGIDAVVGFGASLLSDTPHLLIELEVPLLIPAGFGTPGGPLAGPGGGGFPNGVYSPEPAFWGSGVANNGIDPPATGAIFTINPNGSTTIVPSVPSAAPEPDTLFLLGLGLLLLAARRRRI